LAPPNKPVKTATYTKPRKVLRCCWPTPKDYRKEAGTSALNRIRASHHLIAMGFPFHSRLVAGMSE